MRKRFLVGMVCMLICFSMVWFICSKRKQTKETPEEKQLAYWRKNLEILTEYAPYPDYWAYMEEYFLIESKEGNYLQREIENCDICAIVHIKETEPYTGKNTFLKEAYKDLIGTMSDPDGEELTQEEIAELLKKRSYLVRFASETCQVTVEVEEYLYDRTGEYQKELPVKLADRPGSASEALGGLIDGFRAAKEARLLLLLYSPKQPGGYYVRSRGSQLITEEGSLVPLCFQTTQEYGKYAGMQLADFTELIQKYEKEGKLSPEIPSGGILPWNLSFVNEQIYEYLMSFTPIQNGERIRLKEEEYPECFQKNSLLSSVLEQLHQGRPLSEVLEWMGCKDREELCSRDWDLGMVRGSFLECTISLSYQESNSCMVLTMRYDSFNPDNPDLTLWVYFQQEETEEGKDGALTWMEASTDNG